MNYTDWINFTFSNVNKDWCLSGIQRITAQELIEHCITFFGDPMPIVKNTSREALMRVFDEMPSVDGFLGVLSRAEILFDLRRTLVQRHLGFFRTVFQTDGYDGKAFMWWERLICASWRDGPRVYCDDAICEELLTVLDHILQTDSRICVKSALHGINEIGSSGPEGVADEILRNFFRGKWAGDAELVAYAQEVAAGEAQ